MHKELVVSLVISLFLLGYLSYLLLAPFPMEVREIDSLLPNTHVKLTGMPEKISYFEEGARFYLNDIEIRASKVYKIENSSLTIEGKVSKYENQIWVEALKLYHD